MTDQVQIFGNGIIFQFKDNLKNGLFETYSESGLYVAPSHEDTSQSTRESIIVAIGPDVKSVKVGDTVIVEPLKWTENFTVNDEKFWKTDEDQILAICED